MYFYRFLGCRDDIKMEKQIMQGRDPILEFSGSESEGQMKILPSESPEAEEEM